MVFMYVTVLYSLYRGFSCELIGRALLRGLLLRVFSYENTLWNLWLRTRIANKSGYPAKARPEPI